MRYTILFILIGLITNVFGQATFDDRLVVDENLRPFYHGVASGDPTSSSVIIWTRVSTDEISVEVKWRIGLDTAFNTIVDSGTIVTNGERDYTVKIDVTNLNSNTYYYYEFEALERKSLIGRTKTAPLANEVDQLRFATVSCSNYPAGYFHVYDRLSERHDIDAFIHLGDYLYEYGSSEDDGQRAHFPPKEMVELSEYRSRYSQYRLDPMLARLHQHYPIISTWDDHESANNAYKDGAENHNPSFEGSWDKRKRVSVQTYYEWMPIRVPDPTDTFRIFRSINYGDLADLFILDTRIYGRDKQPNIGEADNGRKLLGPEQMNWLKTELSNSTAKWKIIAQQVMVGPFEIFGIAFNTDQWDGYPIAREELFGHIRDNNIDNVVVLTGDIHTSWAMDLPFDPPYIPATGEGSVAVEFVTTSVTSSGFPVALANGSTLVKEFNKHMKFINLYKHGFNILDLTDTKAQNDFYFVPTVKNKIDTDLNYQLGFYTNDRENHLNKTRDATTSIYDLPIIPPATPKNTDITTPIIDLLTSVTMISAYPNPFSDIVSIQFYTHESLNLQASLYSIDGKEIWTKDLGFKSKGLLHNEHFDGTNIESGNYVLRLSDGERLLSWKLTKN